jgi:hypothetical protein
MKTTERITRLNDDMWLYEIRTEDPAILTGPFTVRYPMRNDPTYQRWEYACHAGNTITPNYVTPSRHERPTPVQEPAVPASDAKNQPVKIAADLAQSLSGRWVGRPQIKTIDYDIEVEFTPSPDGTIVGRLIGTTLPKEQPVNRPFRNFRMNGRQMNWTFPNTQEWSFAGELAADGTITGVTSSAQGGVPLTFRKR